MPAWVGEGCWLFPAERRCNLWPGTQFYLEPSVNCRDGPAIVTRHGLDGRGAVGEGASPIQFNRLKSHPPPWWSWALYGRRTPGLLAPFTGLSRAAVLGPPLTAGFSRGA